MTKATSSNITLAARVCLCVGLIVSALYGTMLRRGEEDHIRLEFAHTIDICNENVNAQMARDWGFVNSVRALFDASEDVTRDEFETFTGLLLSNVDSIHSLGWIPRIESRDRLAVEARARQDGLSGFEITERKAQGSMIRAMEREQYFPVYYIEPLEGNRAALGFDLGSNASRLAALHACRDTGEPRTTERITLVQEVATEWAVLLYVPVYKGNPTSVTERRETLRGVAAGVLRIHDMLVAAGAHAPDCGDIKMEILDTSAPSDTQLLHETRQVHADLAYRYQQTRALEGTGGRQWTLIATPTIDYIDAQRTSAPWTSALAGLAMTCWLSFHLARLAKEKQRIEAQVSDRTQELRAQSTALTQTNASLEREIGERRVLQKRITDVTDHEQRRLGHELHDSLGQQLAVTSMLAQSVEQRSTSDDPTCAKLLNRLCESAQNAQMQVRALSKGLIPIEIGPNGLTAALSQLAESTRGISEVEVHSEGDDGIRVRDHHVATHLYRIAQEALRNALEHGKVSHVNISIRDNTKGLLLTIEDNGQGFNQDGSAGAGLASMRYRADLIGADLAIASTASGTTVTCSHPHG